MRGYSTIKIIWHYNKRLRIAVAFGFDIKIFFYF